jgi:Outer membrane protein beta-barrel domain
MKKLFLAVIAFSLSIVGVQAQSQAKTGGFKFGVGVDLALPTGNFGTVTSFGIGGQVQGEYMLADNISGIASVGYQSFIGKSFPDGAGGTFKYSYGLIPILVGARFYPSEQFFVGAQIGVGLLHASFQGISANSSGFDYLPQVGYVAGPLQFTLGYNGVSASGGTFGSLQLSAVYTFGGN